MFSSITFGETRYVSEYEGVYLREKASVESDGITVLPYGYELDIIKTKTVNKENWYKVEVEEYGKGFIKAEFTQNTDPFEDMTYLGNWHITAYTHTGLPCANGNMPTAGYTIANNWLDFGTQVYIQGVGIRTVEDRGPTYLGSEWLDVFIDSHDACVQFGSKHLDVYLVSE